MSVHVSLDPEDFKKLIRGETISHDSPDGKIEVALDAISIQDMLSAVRDVAQDSMANQRSLAAPSGKEALGFSNISVDVWFTGPESDPDAEVIIRSPKGTPFPFLMIATEHLMKITAQKSPKGFEESLELLSRGCIAIRSVEDRRKDHGSK